MARVSLVVCLCLAGITYCSRAPAASAIDQIEEEPGYVLLGLMYTLWVYAIDHWQGTLGLLVLTYLAIEAIVKRRKARKRE